MSVRRLPHAGLAVTVVHLGAREPGVVEAVEDGGRTLLVAGERYTLRETCARYVREGEPSYGTRLAFGATHSERQGIRSRSQRSA